MKKALLSVLVIMILLTLPACSQDSKTASGGTDWSAGSESEGVERSSDSYSPVSMNRFKSAVSDIGEAQDVSEDFGFDASMVSGSDGTSYIYIFMTTAEMAEQLITDGDGDGYPDPGLQMIRGGANYEFYREEYENDETGITVCGYYIRVDNMLILVNGDREAEETVKADADGLFRKLGYEMVR
ncbi:MAG: hypothetical protein IKD85_00225 [Firmicutes bacterium]|nr:hypothetical protein [Bacillota bacterium]